MITIKKITDREWEEIKPTKEDKERYAKLLEKYEEYNHWGTPEPLY